MSSLVGNGVYEISGELCLIKHIDMIKAFELCLKIGVIPVFSLPHIDHTILSKVESSKKFRDYVSKFNELEEGVNVSKIEILSV